MGVEYKSFPEVRREAVRLAWIHDYYDGAISGFLIHEGKLRFYELCDFAEDAGERRRYVIRELTEAQIRDEEKWHALFREHVGTHWDDDAEQRTVKPRSEWEKFYGPYNNRERVDYSTCPVLGWFEM
jgi:hypothetical protein